MAYSQPLSNLYLIKYFGCPGNHDWLSMDVRVAGPKDAPAHYLECLIIKVLHKHKFNFGNAPLMVKKVT